MADEFISSTQPDTIGNLLGDDIGGLDHFSSSPFQAAEPLQPQPSAPQAMSSSPPNASKPLVEDDFGFDSHITTTSNPASNPSNSAAPNSSSSFTPGELTSNNPTTVTKEDDDDDDYKENHQHHQGEGNSYHPDDDDDDDGYDDREEDVEDITYQKNGAPSYQDNPAFSDSDSPSEFLHHHPETAREPSPNLGADPPAQSVINDKIEGYDSDEHDYDKFDDDDDVVVSQSEKEYEHPHLDHDDDDDEEEADSLTEENVVVLDDDDDDQFVYSGSAATTTTTNTTTTLSSAIPESPEIIEAPSSSKSFETEPSSPLSSEIPSPFSSSAAPMGPDVAAEAEEASSAFDLVEDEEETLSPALSTTNYAPPSPSAPPAAATFSPSSHSDDATPSAVIIPTQVKGGDDVDDDDAASGFADAVTGGGRVSPSAASTEMKTMDDYDNDDDDGDDHLQMPSAPPLSSSSLSSPSSPPLAPQPSAPPQPVEADPLLNPQIPSSTPQQQASSTLLYNSPPHSTRVESEPESSSFTAEKGPTFTDEPNEVQPKPTLEGPWLKNIDPKALTDLDEDLDEYLRKELYRHLHGHLDGYLADGFAEFAGAEYYEFLDLIYWRDVKKTGVVFGSMLFILLSLAIFSVLSVVAYLSLAILAVTLSFRVYKNIMQAVQKSGEGHPFKEYLEWDIELNDVKTSKVVKLVMKHFNCTARELRRLFLIEDLVDSIKFGLLLWVLTYIGSWFNGMTLIINSVVIVFTLPKVYETYKVQIDNYLAMARSQFNKILQQVQSKLPFLKKKAKAQ